MKKLIILVLLFMFTCFSLNSLSMSELKIDEPVYYKDINNFRIISFYRGNKVEFSDEENWNSSKLWNQIFDYSISVDGKFYELEIKNKEFSVKLLMLLSQDYLVLYEETDIPIFIGASKVKTELLYFPAYFDASSELKEKTTIYSGNNLSKLDLAKPWVEAVNGYGEGESVQFQMNGQEIIIFNGFVSKDKRYLFSQNSRVKTIDLYFKSSKVRKSYELQDTPNPQVIKLESMFNEKVVLTIVDVYKGDKYSDTCLNAIMIRH